MTFGIREVRVRDHGEIARIEVEEEDMYVLLKPHNRRLIVEKLNSLGFSYISIDLEGIRSGSMNKVLKNKP